MHFLQCLRAEERQRDGDRQRDGEREGPTSQSTAQGFYPRTRTDWKKEEVWLQTEDPAQLIVG